MMSVSVAGIQQKRAGRGARPAAPARCQRPGGSRERRSRPSAPRSRRAERSPRRTACRNTRSFHAAPGGSRPRGRLEPCTRGLRCTAPAPSIGQAGPRPRGDSRSIPIGRPGHRASVRHSPDHGPARPHQAGSGYPRRCIRPDAVRGNPGGRPARRIERCRGGGKARAQPGDGAHPSRERPRQDRDRTSERPCSPAFAPPPQNAAAGLTAK